MWFAGEFLGTFLLVLLGLGAGAASLLAGSSFPVPLAWGLAVVIAVHFVGPLSGAHLNPAVSLGLMVAGRFPARRLAGYAFAQCLGAFAASLVLYAIYRGAISQYETAHGIVRGAAGSEATAMLFGEYFPNPGGRALGVENRLTVSLVTAFFSEVFGTAVLLLAVLGGVELEARGRSKTLVVSLVGLTVTALIVLLGPVTMACLNPARDLAPRVFSSLAGWGGVVFSANGWGWVVVYVLAPLAGAVCGALLHRSVLARWYRATH